ncbi:MAG: bacterial Ig-like domain-containing protein, partial [Clostridia bacterium]|nr:bacterial Ig-like domain-containing protein [Clostridia bacterium]
MKKLLNSRALITLAVFTALVCVLCVTAFADSIRYDFTGYGSADAAAYDPDSADEGGWYVVAPETEKGSADLYFYTTVKSTGVTDNISKHNGINNGIQLVYNIPTSEQVKIKNYGEISFTRTLVGGASVANMWGATYSISLVMDDGQTVTRDYPWFDSTRSLRPTLATVKDNSLWDDIQALQGDPTLTQIIYKPYSSDPQMFYMASSDYYKENEDGSVAQNGTTLTFVTQYLQLNEMTAPPLGLEGVADTWNGTETDIHDGKIIGLNPNYTYSYAPVHSLDNDFISVTNAEEISNLKGGVYEIYCTEADKSASKRVIVVVPKTTQGSYDNLKNWTPAANGGNYNVSTTPVAGYWSGVHSIPSPAGTASLNTSYRRNAADGDYYNYSANVGLGALAGEYFRRNVVAYTYAFDVDEQFDVDKTAITSSQNISQYIWSKTPIADGKATCAILVYTNGDMENPAVFEFPWTSTSSTVNINASAELDGYVTAIKYVHLYSIPDEEVTATSETQSAYVIYYGLKSYELKESSFVLPDLAPVDENEYKFIGLDIANSYRISTDKKVWTTYSGVTEISGLTKGTYYVQALGNDVEAASKIFELKIEGAQETVSGLEYSDGRITGLDAEKPYEYSKVNLNPFQWTEVAEGSTEIEGITNGVWAVRLAGDSTHVAGAPQYIIARGEGFGSINWGKVDPEVDGFVQGTWTTAGDSGYTQLLADKQFGDGDTRLRYVQNWKTVYADRLNYAWSYALLDNEVFPVSNLTAVDFALSYGAKWPWEADATLTARFRFYIAGGEVPYYDIDVDYTTGIITLDPSTVISADAKGFVTAITVWPVYEANPSTVLLTGNNYPTFKLDNFCADGAEELENGSDSKWRVQLYAIPAPESLKLELDKNAGYIVNGYKIVGLDGTKSYEYSFDGGEYTAVEDGQAFIECATAGVYNVRLAATELDGASSYVSFIVPAVNPVFADRTISEYVYTKSQSFIEGQWSTWPGNWDKTNEPTSSIGTTTPLNTVSYKYTFAPRDYFKVDDNPYFSIDYNYQLQNMGTTSFAGSVFSVDIYVVGEETPYTVSSVYNGYARVDGYTPNKILVNLLDEYPELSGKTVRAFDIRPFPEIDKTPNDYNTAAEKDRYMYFRLFYVGFFDTPANTDAAALATNERVNSLVGIRAEANTIYSLGATASENDYTVYEVYSDGAEHEITSFEVITPDGFAQTSGTYTVEIKARQNKSATVDVAVGLERIEVKTAPEKTEYFEGDTLDLTGLEVIAILGDGTEISVEKGYTLSSDVAFENMTSVTVVYGGCEASFGVSVTPLAVEVLEFNTLPDKELDGTYYEGDEVDLTGLTVKAVYNSGREEIIQLEELDVSYDAEVMTRGAKLTVSYEGKSVSVVLTVSAKAINEVTITAPAEKTVYMAGEELDITGLELTVNYEDGTSEVVTEGFIADADLSEAGEVAVSILYEGFTLEYTVIVRIIESSFIMTPPTKTEYVIGEELDTEGLELYVLYSDGEEAYLTEGFELIYDAFTEAG